MDEIAALRRSQRVFREASVVCFTETWLSENILDSAMELTGFYFVHADRSSRESDKLKWGGKVGGGGVTIYVTSW